MGMYDEIFVQHPLPDDPDGENKNTFFQTKDFDCTLSVYTITYDGRLKHSSKDMNFDGDLNFYSFGYEYLAHFKDGQLQNIERIPYG
jgi:hypothetical protein